MRNLPGPVFDAGCGRGEFLALLKKEGIAARGVETSAIAVQACRAAGLDVREGDAIEALAGVATASLGGVVAFQVVEHWPAAATFRFLAEARRAIAPGGVLIVETVNTDSLAAMNAFYLDPTHVRPVPPGGAPVPLRCRGLPGAAGRVPLAPSRLGAARRELQERRAFERDALRAAGLRGHRPRSAVVTRETLPA